MRIVLIGVNATDKVEKSRKTADFAGFAIYAFIGEILHVDFGRELFPVVRFVQAVFNQSRAVIIVQTNFRVAVRNIDLIKFIVNALTEFSLQNGENNFVFLVVKFQMSVEPVI